MAKQWNDLRPEGQAGPIRRGRPRAQRAAVSVSPAVQDGPLALLRAVMAVLRRYRVPLALWVAACMVLAAVYARLLTPVYTASSTLLLQSAGVPTGMAEDTITPLMLDLNRVDSELQVIQSERLQSLVFDGLGLASDPEFAPRTSGQGQEAGAATPDDIRQQAFARFRERFSARRVGQSYVIEITYAAASPERAARVANAAVSAYLMQSVASKAGIANNGGEFVQGRLDSLSAQVEDAANALRQGRLPDGQMPDADARVIGAALRPLSPSAPRPKLIIAMGGLLALMSGLFVLSLKTALDRRVHQGATLERETGLPCLAVLPPLRAMPAQDANALVTMQPHSGFARAMQGLRTGIDISGTGPQQGGRVTALVSWAPGAGRGLICMNLARLIQTADRKVTVVDADPAAGARGLTALYAPDPAPRPGTKPAEAQTVDAEGVALLTAPALRAQCRALSDLRDPGFATLLDRLRAQGDVLLDLPALSESTDALVLARLADAVVIVLPAESTLDEAMQTAAQLKKAGAIIIGAAIVPV